MSEPILWLGYWVIVAGILVALIYLERHDKGDKK